MHLRHISLRQVSTSACASFEAASGPPTSGGSPCACNS